MRNECQDILITARNLLAQCDYDNSLSHSTLILDGKPQCLSCHDGDDCWSHALGLIADVTEARSRAHLAALEAAE